MRPPPNFFVFREIREFSDLPYAVLKFPKLLKLPNPFTAYKRIRREFHNCRLLAKKYFEIGTKSAFITIYSIRLLIIDH